MNKSIRNIVIFVFVALTCGWLGVFVDRFVEPQSEGESLGMGIWLVFPLLAVILLRFFAGDGWKDLGIKPNFKRILLLYLTVNQYKDLFFSKYVATNHFCLNF